MANIPEVVKNEFIVKELKEYLVFQGKVRDVYRFKHMKEYLRILLATDRISIFDFVLPALIPGKGEVLTAFTHFWFRFFNDITNHLFNTRDNDPDSPNIAYTIQSHIPELPLARSLAVNEYEVTKFELIFRKHLGGSVFSNYLKTGIVAGIQLPPNIQKWSEMEEPLFTPSTKAEDGHDINITQKEFFDATGKDGKRAVKILTEMYNRAYDYAKSRGILILDTKFEISITSDGRIIILDEIFTPDSSRLTLIEDWEKAMKAEKDPDFYDKEVIRLWGKTIETPFTKDGEPIVGINKLDPENPDHVAFVHGLKIPEDIISQTVKRIKKMFLFMTDITVEEYVNKHLTFQH